MNKVFLLVGIVFLACQGCSVAKTAPVKQGQPNEGVAISSTIANSQVIQGNNTCQIQGSGNTVISGSGCNSNQGIQGSGNVIEQTRPSSVFSAVEASGLVTVHLTYGKTHSIRVRAEDNIINSVVTSISGNKLTIALRSGSYNLTRPLEVFVAAPTFSSLEASGQVNFLDSGSYQGGSVAIEATGQSKIILDEFTFGSSQGINASGQSEIVVFIDGRISSVEASGQGNITIRGVDRIADLDASGQVDINLQGAPELENHDVSGQAEIQFF